MASIFGNGEECYVRWSGVTAGAKSLAFSGTDPFYSDPIDIRNLDEVGLQLVTVSANVAAVATIQVSNDYVPASGGTAYGQSPSTGTYPSAGTWSNATAVFSPTIAAIAFGTASSMSQYTKGEVRARSFRVVLTPSAGSGTFTAIFNGKSWS